MDKMQLKKELLKMLSDEMKAESKSSRGEMLPKKMEKVTVMSDSAEGLKKGLSKAEEIMEARSKMKGDMMSKDMLEDMMEEEEESEEECGMCGKKPCEC